MGDYKKRDVWKKAHQTYLFIKKNLVIKFSKKEGFELTAQLNRAALSIPLPLVKDKGDFRTGILHIFQIQL